MANCWCIDFDMHFAIISARQEIWFMWLLHTEYLCYLKTASFVSMEYTAIILKERTTIGENYVSVQSKLAVTDCGPDFSYAHNPCFLLITHVHT